MGRIRSFLLVLFFIVFSQQGMSQTVCIVDSYQIKETRQVVSFIEKELEDFVEIPFSEFKKEKLKGCSSLILLGTPAVARALKENVKKRIVYSFVLFPEALSLEKKKNFFGIRIIPLPQKTVEVFFNYTKLKKEKVALPVSDKTYKIAKNYIKGDSILKLVKLKKDYLTLEYKLLKYRYIFIFPDPYILKVLTLLKLLNFAKENKKVLITNLPDLENYGINFIYAVDLKELSKKILDLLESNSSERILPCPAKVKRWSP
nr:hypothetical protein [Desulfurobacterium thermolithotrophum]